jgi:hypothetical protein
MKKLAIATATLLLAILTAWVIPQLSRYRVTYLREVFTRLHGIEVLENARVPMRDGITLSADVYLPQRFDPPYPAILVQTPYGNDRYFGGMQALQWFVPHGYALVFEDVRGRFESEGDFSVYDHAVTDGWDTLDWIAAQDWSSGRIGTYGCSALGEVQYMLAGVSHPNHKAMIVQAGGGAIGAANDRYGYFGLFEGGVFNLAAGAGWFAESGGKGKVPVSGVLSPELIEGLPIVDLVADSGASFTDYEAFVTHEPGDPWWDQFSYVDEARGFQVPGLHVNSWYDLGAEDTVTLAMGLGIDDPAPQHVIMSPATHCQSELLEASDTVGDLIVRNANLPYAEVYRTWFDHWLRDGPDPELPRLEVFVIGQNEWVALDTWPPGRMQSWFLASEDGANSSSGDGRLQLETPPQNSDSFEYDPLDPVRSRGGPHCCTGTANDEPGAFDQSASAAREDVLVYDSEPLERSMTIIGPVRVELTVATSAPDTDFTAKLVDVAPDGSSINVQDGAFRLRYRDGYREPVLAEPGEWYPIEVGLRATAYRFEAGHRIRLEVSSSNFPRLARNLNGGGAPALESVAMNAVNSVAIGGAAPSRLRLPIYETERSGSAQL